MHIYTCSSTPMTYPICKYKLRNFYILIYTIISYYFWTYNSWEVVTLPFTISFNTLFIGFLQEALVSWLSVASPQHGWPRPPGSTPGPGLRVTPWRCRHPKWTPCASWAAQGPLARTGWHGMGWEARDGMDGNGRIWKNSENTFFFCKIIFTEDFMRALRFFFSLPRCVFSYFKGSPRPLTAIPSPVVIFSFGWMISTSQSLKHLSL